MKSTIAESYCNSMFSFVKNHKTAFQRSYIIFSFECALLSNFFVFSVTFFLFENCTFEPNNVVTLEIIFFPFSRVCCFLFCFYFLIFIGCLCAKDQPEV